MGYILGVRDRRSVNTWDREWRSLHIYRLPWTEDVGRPPIHGHASWRTTAVAYLKKDLLDLFRV